MTLKEQYGVDQEYCEGLNDPTNREKPDNNQ